MTPSNQSVRIGVMGAGSRIRGVLHHLFAAAPPGSLAITAAYDPSADAIAALRAGGPHALEAVDSERALAAHPDVDWVFIGSWNVFHARQAIAALAAGKDVFCEKPLATTLEDSLAMQDAVRASGRTFALGLVLRYSLLYQKVREIVQNGSLGRLISFEFNETLPFNHGGYIFGNWRRQSANSGSHLLEKCCHDIDLVNWITGQLPVRAASFGGTNFFVPANAHHAGRIGANAEGKAAYATWADPGRVSPFSGGADIVDNQVAILEYADGLRAAFHTNCHAALPERRMYFCGTEGALRADAVTGTIEWQRVGHDTQPERVETGVRGGHAGGDEFMAAGLVRTILEGEPPLAGVEDGLRSGMVAFAVDRAMREGRVVEVGGSGNAEVGMRK